MGYTSAQLQQVKRRAERFAKDDPQGGKVRGSSGRLSMRIPQDAYFAAIENNGGVRKDGTNIWNDSEWVRDMKIRNPEICRGGAGVTFPPGITRFGKATEHIVYPKRTELEQEDRKVRKGEHQTTSSLRVLSGLPVQTLSKGSRP